ncbi:lipopolysaccharide biosynthesis protein [Curtobacterium sp. VKM Ac-1393]|uniref:lipopolysaccharide biosynthesis protein n=1 Tax=Curtobacterium sp. VKM Ac-1393 TaxID=2783814 RepID=UPI00188AC48D|nr:oligosaccharide flippase family protein [Curtobacterium sp. VKM Ac-1393]MBF4606175.1 oligosaccharide flippase family protein [Curtobacterium sp. VKM Ac-1393]
MRPSPRRRFPAIATILVGTVFGQGLVVAISPLLTRLYTPSDFGTLAVVTAVASILGAGATLGTDRAVLVAHDTVTTRSLVVLGLLATLAVGAGTAGVTWALREDAARWFTAPALEDLWWTIPVTVVVVGAQRIASAVLARRQQHRSIAVRNACQGIGQSVWNLAMAAAGPIGLVGGLAVGRIAALLGMARLRRTTGAPLSARTLSAAARHHRRFLVITPWSSMLNVIGQQAPGLLIAAVHGSVAAGFVALTMRVLGAPVGMIADATAQYAAGAFGLRIRSGDPVRHLVVRLVVRLATAGALAALVVVVLGPAVFSTVFGSEWAVSGTYAQILVPAFAIQVAASPVTQVLSMVHRQGAQLTWDVVRLVLSATAVLVPSALGAPMPVVLVTLASAMSLSYAVVLVLVLRAARIHDAGTAPKSPM